MTGTRIREIKKLCGEVENICKSIDVFIREEEIQLRCMPNDDLHWRDYEEIEVNIEMLEQAKSAAKEAIEYMASATEVA